MEINGVAHTFITAGDFAAARAFYRQLLPFLGLTIVAELVHAHNGQLDIASAPGTGTLVTVTLPVAAAESRLALLRSGVAHVR